jgi:tetratricopeptide (TPR) repeat protein
MKKSASNSNIDLDNPEFQNVWKLVSYTHQSVFMTGKAGTGKTTFLKYIQENTRKKFVVLAPTGIAAVNAGGVTLHSFFKIPFKPLLPDDPDFKVSRLRKRLKYSKSHAKLIKELQLIIIDEISMVRADIIDFIDKVLRVYSGNMREPFGGKQLLLVGDIFQLEPVVTSDMREVLRHTYSNSYFFSALAFKELSIVSIELQKVYRQEDPTFVNLLDRFRVGMPSADDISALNQRVAPDYEPSGDSLVMTLATRRDMVDSINTNRLAQLKSKEFTFDGKVEGDFPESSLPAPKQLTLKVGAQVVFVKNDFERRWVNGTVGRVYSLSDDELEIELEGGQRHHVEINRWENIVYQYDEQTKRVIEKVVGAYEQYPLRLAWALTIHKSQGLTFNNVVIDIGRGAFTSGQTYVALSRCTSLDGIILRSSVNQRDAFVNPSIIEFSGEFNNGSRVEEALSGASADDSYCRASKAFDDGNYRAAVDLLAEAISARNDLGRGSVRRLISRKLSRIKQLESKVELLTSKLAEDTKRFRELANEYVSMGVYCLEDAGDFTAAIANFNKALKLAPDYGEALYQRGLAYELGGDTKAAIKDLRAASQLAENVKYELALAKIYMSNDNLHEALNTLLIAVNRYKNEPDVHLSLAQLYDKIGDEESADYHRATAKKLQKRRQSRR